MTKVQSADGVNLTKVKSSSFSAGVYAFFLCHFDSMEIEMFGAFQSGKPSSWIV